MMLSEMYSYNRIFSYFFPIFNNQIQTKNQKYAKINMYRFNDRLKNNSYTIIATSEHCNWSVR